MASYTQGGQFDRLPVHIRVNQTDGINENIDTTTDNASSVDGLLVVAIIFIWIISIVLFYRKWENIRAMKPTDGIYRQLPKNLETIRVVKQQKDSVILNVSERKASFHLKQNSKLQRSFTDPSFPLAIMEV